MPLLKVTEILSYSSEDKSYPAENLLKLGTYLKWKSDGSQQTTQQYVVLKLEKLSQINSIDIGNEHSAFVEVLVAREGVDYQVLLVASCFMSPLESRNGTEPNRVRMFDAEKINKKTAQQKWDRLKIICSQPFNKNVQYGLSFVKVYGPENKEASARTSLGSEVKLGRFTLTEEDDDDEANTSIQVGSFFSKRRDTQEAASTSPAVAIRAASKMAADVGKKRRNSASEDAVNAPQQPFYQLKKKAKESPTCSPASRIKPALTDEKVCLNQPPPKDLPQKPQREQSKDQQRQKTHAKACQPQNEQSKDQQQPHKQPSTPSQRPKTRLFKALMNDVVFAMSGYQNPRRGILRDNLLAMGAKYKPDWGPDCTHLICAFTNTPKFQVAKGKGRIVTAKWVDDSFNKKTRFPTKRYNLDKSDSGNDGFASEEEILSIEIASDSSDQQTHTTPKEVGPSRNDSKVESKALDEQSDEQDSPDTDDEVQKVLVKDTENTNCKKESPKITQFKDKTTDDDSDVNGDYDADTDEEKEKKVSLAELPSFLKGKVFMVHAGDQMTRQKRREIERYVVACDGKLSNYMNGDVHFVLTDLRWDDQFDEALRENSHLRFIRPSWLWRCCDANAFLTPHKADLVRPHHKENG